MLFHLADCRSNARRLTLIIARTLLASVFLVGVAATINAQPVLVETQVEAGNFNPFGIAAGCSSVSTQFQNLPAVSPTDPAFFTVSSKCKNVIEDWVSNVGTSPTSGLVTKTFILSPDAPRSLTVLSVNGFTAAPGNISAGKANGWACTPGIGPFQPNNVVTCTRSDALAPGKVYPAIVLSVLVESYFSAPPELNIYSTVSGGGMSGRNWAFDVVNTFPGDEFCMPGIKKGSAKCTDTRLTVQTAPPGLGAIVDGSQVGTPHWFFYLKDTIHTFEEPRSLNGSFVLSSGLTTNDASCLTATEPPIYPGVSPPADNCTIDGATEIVFRPTLDVNSPTLANTFTVFVRK